MSTAYTLPGSRLSRHLSFTLVLMPFLLWMLLVILLPHVDMLLLSFQEKISAEETRYSMANYFAFFNEPIYLKTLLRTVLISIFATALTLLISWPVAYYIAKLAQGRSKPALYMACLLPFWVGELVRVLGWMMILRESGLLSASLQALGLIQQPIEFLYHDATMIVGLIYTSMLFMIVPLTSALESLDDSLVEAAYDLGGNGWVVLWQVIVPHALPGIVAGCIIVFMLNLGNYLTPTLLGGSSSQWFTEQIYTQFITRFNWELGSAFGFVLLLTSSVLVWLGLKLSGQSLSSSLARG